jgi:hypothetical protein
MTERDVFDDACQDIKTNLWVLNPVAQSRILGWFAAIMQDAYKRGIADEAQKNAKADHNV